MAQAAKRVRVPRRAGAAARWRAALAELRTLPAAQVADALSGWACVDDYVVSDDVLNLIRSRDHKDVPLIRKDKGRRVFSPAFLFVRLIRAVSARMGYLHFSMSSIRHRPVLHGRTNSTEELFQSRVLSLEF